MRVAAKLAMFGLPQITIGLEEFTGRVWLGRSSGKLGSLIGLAAT